MDKNVFRKFWTAGTLDNSFEKIISKPLAKNIKINCQLNNNAFIMYDSVPYKRKPHTIITLVRNANMDLMINSIII